MFARDQGKLGKGTEFTGYAARFLPRSDDLETLTLMSRPSSTIDHLNEKVIVTVNLYLFDTITLCMSLITLPTFFGSLVTIAYVWLAQYIDGQRKREKNSCQSEGDGSSIEEGKGPPSNEPDKLLITSTNENIVYLTISILVASIVANVIMVLLQLIALQKRYEWFYVYPYVWLWVLVVVKFFTSLSVVYKLQFSSARFFKDDVPVWIETIILWTGCVTIQLLSWHLAFVLLGFILNPLRASLYCAVIFSAVLCFIVLLATVIKTMLILIFSCVIITTYHDDIEYRFPKCLPKPVQFIITMMFGCAAMWKQEHNIKMEQGTTCMCLKMPESLKEKFPFMNVTILMSLTMLWLYMYTYGVFSLQVSITDNVQISGGISPSEAVKLIITNLFMAVLALFATKLFGLRPNCSSSS